MARQWIIFDDWTGGGFFADGSFNAGTRYRSINMQRYSNGSIGPRPQWFKLTQSADISSSIPSQSTATGSPPALQLGTAFAPRGPSGWFNGVILLISRTDGATGGLARRIKPSTFLGGTAEYFPAADIGEDSTGDELTDGREPSASINTPHIFIDGSLPVWVAGHRLYDPVADTVANITARTVSATAFMPRKVVFYQGRMYGWDPHNQAHPDPEAVIFSDPLNPTDFSTTDAGNFFFASSSPSWAPATPRGAWALPSGLLFFSTEGQTANAGLYTGVTSPQADHGRWDILRGRDTRVGSVQQLDWDMGPAYYSLSIVHEGRVLFPVGAAGKQHRGWAIHDGNTLDKTSLANLRPGGGNVVIFMWLAPVATDGKPSLILPYYVQDSDPTSGETDFDDNIGEYSSRGFGAFEYVNGAWTENLYLHGQGHLVGHGKLEEDKLYMIHLDTTDDGDNFFPQVWTREVSMDRPSTVAMTSFNEWSNGTEDAPAKHVAPGALGSYLSPNDGGATGHMHCRLETGERTAPNGFQYEVSQITIDYDYWNSAQYDSDCGFEVDIIYRALRDRTKLTQRISSSRITPPGTSLTVTPERARVVLNLDKRIAAGSFQVRITDLKGCAIHNIAVAVDESSVY